MFRLTLALLALIWSSLSTLSIDDPPEDDEDDSDDEETPPAAETPYRVYKTEKEFQAAFGPTRIEGRDAEANRWKEKLGVQTDDEALELVDQARQIRQDAETEAETARREKEEADRKAQQARDEVKAERERSQASVKRIELRDAMRAAGVRDDRLQKALKEAVLDNLDIDDEDNVSGAKEEVERIKVDIPEWFNETQDEGVPSTRGATGGGGGGGSKKASSRWLDRRVGIRR